MPISNGTFTVPNNFVQQYDQGQKKIRADLMDENFNDVAGAINALLTDDANTVHLTGAETISGNKTFTETIIGNSSTSTALQTARTINGVSFDGTENITVADSTKVALDGSNLSGATVKTVIETWHSGTEWYRVWSDGWIEQGGYLSVPSPSAVVNCTLNKSFSNSNYMLFTGAVFIVNADTNHQESMSEFPAKTSTGFSKYIWGSFSSLWWFACGY